MVEKRVRCLPVKIWVKLKQSIINYMIMYKLSFVLIQLYNLLAKSNEIRIKRLKIFLCWQSKIVCGTYEKIYLRELLAMYTNFVLPFGLKKVLPFSTLKNFGRENWFFFNQYKFFLHMKWPICTIKQVLRARIFMKSYTRCKRTCLMSGRCRFF